MKEALRYLNNAKEILKKSPTDFGINQKIKEAFFFALCDGGVFLLAKIGQGGKIKI